MPRAASESHGASLVARLNAGLREANCALRSGARDLPLLRGVTPQCQFILPQENVLAAATQILVNSERVYWYGNSVVLETDEGGGRTIQPLTTAHTTEEAAASLMANLFTCEIASKNPDDLPIQFPPSNRLVGLLLNREPTRQHLPQIKLYSTRPVFDDEYRFLGPGWHPDVGILVHGPDVEPYIPVEVPTGESMRDRLPPRLRGLFRDFCFRGDADLVNAVAVLLTGLLVPQFVCGGKPLNLLDGNQPGVGKTLLARAVGVILDGTDPAAIHFTMDDEELAKRICANLRGEPTSVVLIDNAKLRGGGEVSSPVLEANSMAPQVSLRILGKSANYRRPNDLIWFLTMNLTKTSSDLVSRGLPIRFLYEGDPQQRQFGGRNPIEFADRHREEILGELAGMVVFWNQRGRPDGTAGHRLTQWARVIGGILGANGLVGFLENLDEAASEFNTALDALAGLAEAAMAENGDGFVRRVPVSPGDGQSQASCDIIGRPAGDWKTVFVQAGVLSQELNSTKSNRSQATQVGNFLGQHLDREVQIDLGGSTGLAVLRCAEGRSRRRLYHFEVRADAMAELEVVPSTVLLNDGLDPTGAPEPVVDQVAGGERPDSDEDHPGDATDDGHSNQEDW